MLKILHAADLHLDSPLSGRSEGATKRLRAALQSVPEKIAALCVVQKADILLISGDVFDTTASVQGIRILKAALQSVAIPVFISPGNHDFCAAGSPWLTEVWPENVHVFTKPEIESISLPALDCRIYGAAFTSVDSGALLENFQKQGQETYHIAVLHGDPVQQNSTYNPITREQVAASGLDYLALGHVHKLGSFRAGETLCAWPGCPMGRGFDELEEKGVLMVTVDGSASLRFLPFDVPRFYDLEAPVLTTVEAAVAGLLPAFGNEDFYRITLTGECAPPNLDALMDQFSQFPNLELRDQTQPPVDIWGSVDEDSLEGVYFRMLKEAMVDQDEQSRRIVQLAAKISKKILNGEEVVLP